MLHELLSKATRCSPPKIQKTKRNIWIDSCFRAWQRRGKRSAGLVFGNDCSEPEGALPFAHGFCPLLAKSTEIIGKTHGWIHPQLYAPSVVLLRRVGPPASKFNPFALGHLFEVSTSLLFCRGVRKIASPLISRRASSSIFVGGVHDHNDHYNHLARPSSSIFA